MQPPVLIVQPQEQAVTAVTLNRPERRNALNIGLLDELCETIQRLQRDASQRVVIFRGSGPVFCAGLDLHEAAQLETAERSAELVHRLLHTVTRCELITIAAVHGAALAGGAGLVAACDLVVASRAARIGFPEVRRGLVPALVAGVLRHKLRDGALRELLLAGEPVTARRAREMGLVNYVVPAGDEMDTAVRCARQVVEGAPSAVRETKQLLATLHDLPVEDTANRLLQAHKQARRSEEAKEGLAAFLEKRGPNWT